MVDVSQMIRDLQIRNCRDGSNLEQFEDPLSIFPVHQSVVVHSVHLVDPQSNERLPVLQRLRLHEETAEHDTGKVSQVEDVV